MILLPLYVMLSTKALPLSRSAQTLSPDVVLEKNRAVHEIEASCKLLLSGGQPAEAEPRLRSALKSYPDEVVLTELLVEALSRQKKDQDVLMVLDTAQKASLPINDLMRALMGLAKTRVGRLSESEREWNPKVLLNVLYSWPDMVEYLPKLGGRVNTEAAWLVAAAFQSELHSDRAGAHHYFARAANLIPQNVIVNYYLAGLANKLGETNKALSFCDIAINNSKGSFKKRIENLKLYVQHPPVISGVQVVSGELPAEMASSLTQSQSLLDQGQAADAEKGLRSTLDKYPGSAPVKDLLVESLVRQDKDQEAFQMLKDNWRKHSGLVREHSQILAGLLKARLGYLEESRSSWSRQLITKYTVGSPEVEEYILAPGDRSQTEAAWLATAGFEANVHADDTGSDFYFSRAAKLVPNNPFINFYLGEAALHSKKFAKAATCYEIAMKHSSGQFRHRAETQHDIAQRQANNSG